MVGKGRWVVVALLAVTGCDSGAAAPEPVREPTSVAVSTAPSVVSESASVSTPQRPEVEPPERPAAMDVDDSAGAAAAVDYFLRLGDYLVATGDRGLWDGMSADSCRWCASYADLIAGVYEDGSWIERDPLIFDILETPVGLPLPDNPTYVMHPVVEQPPATVWHPDGTSTQHRGAIHTRSVEVCFVGGTFLVTGVQLDDLE